MKDGVILMYVMDGVSYPVAMTQEQYDMLQFLVKPFEPLQVIKDHPQGKVINLMEED